MDGKMNFVRRLTNVMIQSINLDGIYFPESAGEKDKALIVMCSVFIDYLLFENF